MYRVVRINFRVALLITVLLGCVVLFTMHPSMRHYTSPGSGAPLMLALFIASQVGLWFYAYRNDEGYVAAAASGLALSEPLVANLLLPDVTDQPMNLTAVVFLLYLSLSYFAYAIGSWNLSRKSWLDPL